MPALRLGALYAQEGITSYRRALAVRYLTALPRRVLPMGRQVWSGTQEAFWTEPLFPDQWGESTLAGKGKVGDNLLFDHLFFKLNRRQIAQAGMQTLDVVDVIEEGADVCQRLRKVVVLV